MTWHTVIDAAACPGDGGQRYRRLGVQALPSGAVAVAWPGAHGVWRPAEVAQSAAAGAGTRSPGAIDPVARAPMAATVLTVRVAVGDRVEARDVWLVLEAMKMEHRLIAPAPGRIVAVHVRAGEQVAQGAVLITFEADDA